MFAGLAARQRSGVDYRRPTVGAGHANDHHRCSTAAGGAGRIRARGWSFDNGEDYPDVRCVAAPVFNANNDLTAAISVVGTRLQINEDNRDYLAGKAIACAKDISRLLGWKSPFEQLASS